jgi:formate dehydrogenase major subunit
MTDTITFTLDGREVEASAGETIWQVAKRVGTAIPHLCHKDAPGYRSDGNCRACVVEIEGERTLAASCIRTPAEGMVVTTASRRAKKAREMVFELLASDMPPREEAPDRDADFWIWSDIVGVEGSRFDSRYAETTHHAREERWDTSHPAIAVNLDACIACGLCERACREVQVNDVIGMGYRGGEAPDLRHLRSDGRLHLRRLRRMRAGLSDRRAAGKERDGRPRGANGADRERTVDSVCPFCGVGCQTTVHVKDERIIKVDGRDGPANENRLCVKGRFGHDYIRHPHRLTRR